jgi:hypothetical protein
MLCDAVALASQRIGVWRDCVAAAMGELPGEGAGLVLAEVPAGCLLGLVMPSAQRGQIALTRCAAAVVRNDMIKIAASGGSSAAWV